MVKNICIVGGGTAGLITALILKTRYHDISIEIVKSDKIGIIGVGEGSTEHWQEFIDFVGLDLIELIKETKATFKYGIMFEGWTENPYFHNVESFFNNAKYGQYLAGYGYAVKHKIQAKDYTDKWAWSNKVGQEPNHLPRQYHFNTFLLNDYLLKKCKDLDIKITNDEITEIIIQNDKILELASATKKYKSDFYVDCTGFKKLLISKLGSKWVSYSKFLPMNEAIAFPTKDTNEYNTYTLAKAMSCGWMWRIPTQGRWGNGYVFNNNFIDAAGAQKECEDYLGYKIKIGKNIKFEAGTIDRPWIGNCVATGLASSFIEPLEASSIGTSIQQAFLLMHLLKNYNKKDIELYNNKYTKIVENIRDFVLLHYIVKKNDSKFWDQLEFNLPRSLEHLLDKWSYRLPIATDFDSSYLLFRENNFAIILKELNLFNYERIAAEFDSLNPRIKFDMHQEYQKYNNHYAVNSAISHKKRLENL